MSLDNEQWDKVISSDSRNGFSLKNISKYKDLIESLIKRGFVTYYKQTVLGPLWYIIQPLCSVVMYMFIFGNLANIGTDAIPQPLFYFSGVIIWTLFSSVIRDVSNVFFNNKSIFGKVYFPRIVVPIADVAILLLKFLLQLVFLGFLYVFYAVKFGYANITIWILLVPVIVMWVSILGLGLGLIVSSITTKYRDLALALDYFISLAMYASPIVYPLSQVSPKLRFILTLNPVSTPIEMFRYALFGEGTISVFGLVYSIMLSAIILLLGLRRFNIYEKKFIDVI